MPWAIHGQTTAEIVLARADASKPNTGLTNYTGSKPRKSDVGIAKNYLNEDELKALNLIVSALHLFQLNRTARNIFCSVERDTVRRTPEGFADPLPQFFQRPISSGQAVRFGFRSNRLEDLLRLGRRKKGALPPLRR